MSQPFFFSSFRFGRHWTTKNYIVAQNDNEMKKKAHRFGFNWFVKKAKRKRKKLENLKMRIKKVSNHFLRFNSIFQFHWFTVEPKEKTELNPVSNRFLINDRNNNQIETVCDKEKYARTHIHTRAGTSCCENSTFRIRNYLLWSENKIIEWNRRSFENGNDIKGNCHLKRNRISIWRKEKKL